MNQEHEFQHTPLRPLSDDAAAEILNFLQEFTNEFENRYFVQISRYYNRLYHHGQASLFEGADETF